MIETGVPICDLCDKIAVELNNSGSKCEHHAIDPKYYSLNQQNIALKSLLSKFLICSTAKSGFEDDFDKISAMIYTALWDT
jgi:hypothetical protein